MTESLTPIRRQYLRIKKQHPQAIVLFRLGDFYETFGDDAKLAAKELEIVLTSREMGKGNRVPMAGIPHHALESYLARLVGHGHRVAICEQLSPPDGKTLVPREVVRVVTPGTVIEPALLNSRANNYLLSLVAAGTEVGLAYVDITTSEFAATQLSGERAAAEIQRLKPAEIIVPEGLDAAPYGIAAPVTKQDSTVYSFENAERTLLDHFGAATLDGYGCSGKPLVVRAAGSIIEYISETQKASLAQLTRLTVYHTDKFIPLDAATQYNLELFPSHTKSGSLLEAIDLTHTSAGGRLLRRWLGQPLLDITELCERQEAVAWLYDSAVVRGRLISLLGGMSDLERIINRVRGRVALPHELVSLGHSLEIIPRLHEILREGAPFEALAAETKPSPETAALIAAAIAEKPPAAVSEGGLIKPGFDADLDSLRSTAGDARQYLANLEKREKERTGIKSLKVGYNRVFGYYLEISNANIAQAPPEYIRKQTLTNGERFFTPELKEYELKVLNAKELVEELEKAIFRRVCEQVAAQAESIIAAAGAIARIDVLAGLAETAARYGYVRPKLTEEQRIMIKAGRHPVVERNVPGFVANDTLLSNDEDQVIILTGPNMSGKSTYLKQVALIVLLSQIGSFVPAEAAEIGLVDRIFTRIGAREDMGAGQSTFMVEMVETASVLNNATPRSLIILDEIGRGTSTYDGLSIARAVVEYIHNQPRLGARTLFATHYHEMVALADFLPRVKNYSVAAAERNGEVTFLYKVVPGGMDRSYGIHVAKLAGLPRPVLNRAREVLTELENDGVKTLPKRRSSPAPQLSLFGEKSAVEEELAELDVDALSPLEAITKLYELQRQARR